MVILLQINKITFEKSENLQKKNSHKSEPCNRKLLFFKKKVALEETVFDNLEKIPGKLHYETLITLAVTQ